MHVCTFNFLPKNCNSILSYIIIPYTGSVLSYAPRLLRNILDKKHSVENFLALVERKIPTNCMLKYALKGTHLVGCIQWRSIRNDIIMRK